MRQIYIRLHFQALNKQMSETCYRPYLRLSIQIFPESEEDEICKLQIQKSQHNDTRTNDHVRSRIGITDKPFCERSRITRLCQECRVGSFAVATYIPEYGIIP